MIGSAGGYERNYAGLLGPRDCQPLVWSPRDRMGRSADHWWVPKGTTYSVGTTPVLVAKRDINRALLAFWAAFGIAPPGAAAVILALSRGDAASSVGVIALDRIVSATPGGSPPPITVYASYELSYFNEGAKTQEEWWAVTVGATAPATVRVTEWRYFG